MNLLKTLFFCPVFCLSTIINAQRAAPPKHRTGLRLSPNIGFCSSNLINTNLADFYDLKTRAGFGLNAGINVEYLFNDHLGVGVGIGGEQYSYSPYSTWIKISNHAVQSFIYIPVYFHVVTSSVGHIGFFANVGFTYHALTGIRYPDQESNYYTETVGYTNNNVSVQLFAGIHCLRPTN